MKRALLIGTIVLVVVIGGIFLARRLRADNPADKIKYKLAVVEVGQVKKTVSATGTLQPWTTVDIKSKAGGRVDALLVDIGSVVKKGDILAKIDPTDTILVVNQAQADIDSANARIRQAQITSELQKEQSELAVAQAETSLEAAKASLEASRARLKMAEQQKNAQPRLTNSSIASAQANLDNARKQLAELREATHPQERAAAQAAVDQAEANLKNAEANLTRQQSLMEKGFVSQQVVDQALANRDVMKAQVAAARRKLDTIDKEQQAAEAAMVARVQQAEAQLNSAKAAAVDVDIRNSAYQEAKAAVAQAEQQVEDAKKQLELAKANLANIQIRRTEIAQAQASKARAMASLTNARTTLDQTIVRAPTDGVVLQKYVEQGTIISSALSFAATGNNILQLGDITRMYVDVTVDETDIANVDMGQMVDITMDAYPGIPFEGKVTRIDPQAKVEQNVTTIHVRVEVDNSAPSFRLLKPGMNATCEFVIDKKDDVVKVPSEAVRTDDRGRFIEIASGGKPAPPDPETNEPADPDLLIDVKVQRREVEIGLEGNEDVEITSGLKEGEKVVVQKIEPLPQTAGSPFGGGMRGGMRGFGGGRR